MRVRMRRIGQRVPAGAGAVRRVVSVGLAAGAAVLALPPGVAGADGVSTTISSGGQFAAVQAGGLTPSTVTYDTAAVPVGADLNVVEHADSRHTVVLLDVHGLRPNRSYGAHVHVNRCGADPADAGPHYQDRPDPHQPSTDPAYANPANEVWLDFTTDAHGDATATARQNWLFRAGGAHSIVLHDHATATAAGSAGTAGARLACATLPLSSSVLG